jgi:hypothetical protein
MALSLPFGGRGKSQGPPASSEPPPEVQAKYRLLGLPWEATIGEIEAAYDQLLEKYPDDIKRKIDLDVAKDIILEFRMRDRLAGKGKVMFNPNERPEVKEPFFKIPSFLESVMEIPTKSYLRQNLIIFGCISLLPLVAKVQASTCLSLGFGAGLFLLYQRGAPESDDDEMAAQMRPARVRPLLLALGITAVAGFVGGLLSSFVSSFVYMAFDSVFGLCTTVMFFFTSTFFKVQDDEY